MWCHSLKADWENFGTCFLQILLQQQPIKYITKSEHQIQVVLIQIRAFYIHDVLK